MIWRSTTFRFAALVFLLQIAAAGALLIGLGAILRGQIASDAATTSDVLREDLLATQAQGGVPALAQAIRMRTTQSITPRAVILLADAGGRPIAGNLADWPPSVAPQSGHVDLELYRIGHVAPEAMRVNAVRLPGGERLLTGAVIESERQILRLFESATALALALALAFAALAAWLAARMIVTRLETTVATLGAVREGDLARRVPQDRSGDAFAELGAEVNRALDRVDALVIELKTATDGLAHDLKSPLTRMRSALERAVTVVTEPAAQEALDRALAEGERLLAMVETALRVSRAEAGIGKESFAPVDLAEMLETIAEIYAPLAEDHGRVIDVVAPEPVTMPVHRELLGQALGNLVDNSLKYGAGTITLSLSEQDGAVALAVADQGRGIAEGDRGEALRRFGRLDEARGGSGAGLGLSLVAAVARLHDGAVALGDANPGLVVTIRLGAEL